VNSFLHKWIRYLDRKKWQTSHELYGEKHVWHKREEKSRGTKKT
jgi:hypothetical protein